MKSRTENSTSNHRIAHDEARAFVATLTRRETTLMLFQLLGAAENAWITAKNVIERERARPAVSWRGGPDIGAYAEAEYERERADYDGPGGAL